MVHKIYLYRKQDHLGNRNDYRIPGFSISKVKLQDARRKNNVTKLVEMFEKHSIRPIAISLLSLALSSRRIFPVEDQNMVSLKDSNVFQGEGDA